MSSYSWDYATGESCTIFIQRCNLTSKACLNVPLIVKIDSSSIKIHALLDSGAFAYFLDKDFVDCHKLPLVTKKHPILIEVIDGRSLVP